LSIEADFSPFYDLFSKVGVRSRVYQTYIQEAETGAVRRAEDLISVIPADSRKLLAHSALAVDLENVFKRFFGDMSGDEDPEMLMKCFVETPESRAADEALEKIASNLSNRVRAIDSGASIELERTIRNAVETVHGEFVLLIGNKGAGKSTFTDRFFHLVIPRELKERCLICRVDLREWAGEAASLQAWLNAEMKREVEYALFGNSDPDYDDLQGAFFQEYRRWRNAEYRFLYETDKTAFKIKFGEYMAKFAEADPFGYTVKLMRRAIDSNKRMPCLIFDNADHYAQDVQEAVFQYAQAIHRQIFSLVVLPITDQTMWQLGKSGPLQSYGSKSFYLPIPSTKDVIRKRLTFVREKLSANDSGNYVLGKGMRLTIGDIGKFAAVLEEIFVSEDYTSRTVAWLANHDIRRSLEITRGIFTSPWLKIDDLFKTYIVADRLSVPRLAVYKALILGNYDRFIPERSSFILNMFSIHSDDISSPLLKLSILRYLADVEGRQGKVDQKYAYVSEIESYMEVLGASYSITRAHLEELVSRRLVEPYDPTRLDMSEDQKVHITHSGKLHAELALQNQTYLVEMAVTTPMRAGTHFDELKAILSSGRRGKMSAEDWRHLCGTFVHYCISQDRLFCEIPEVPAYHSQRDMRKEWEMRWTTSNQK
jgi:energy-coupling factor transporter ATP-binding protein EcfA2